jgi:uncharacterized membrane protein YkoI
MPNRSKASRRITTVALLGGGVAAGVIGATAIGASAQSTSSAAPSTASTSSTSTTAPNNSGRPNNGETVVTGSKATELKAAALKQVPGGTVQSVTTETDHSGAAYEVHVTKSDGTEVEVLFDSNLNYVTTQTSPGRHGHGGGNGETAVTGANAATLKAAALKQVPGATVEEVSSDSGDAAYEVHLKKADGTEVTAKFDKNLAFVAVEDGRGK